MNLLMSFVWVGLVGVALVGMLLLVGGAIAVAILDSDVDRRPASLQDATIHRAEPIVVNVSTLSRTGRDADLVTGRRRQCDLVPVSTRVDHPAKQTVVSAAAFRRRALRHSRALYRSVGAVAPVPSRWLSDSALSQMGPHS